MNIFCLPGLAFDSRIFRNLEWKATVPRYINWIAPEAGEQFSSYATRIAKEIPADINDPILIGHSLGGMLAQEIAAQRHVKQVILLSSVRSRNGIPWFLKMMRPKFMHRWFRKSIVRRTFPFWARFHDYETKEEQSLFLDMLDKQDDEYLQWALHALSIWKPPSIPNTNIYHIHGQNDRTLPVRGLLEPDKVLPAAGHFMVFKHANLISKYIHETLESE